MKQVTAYKILYSKGLIKMHELASLSLLISDNPFLNSHFILSKGNNTIHLGHFSFLGPKASGGGFSVCAQIKYAFN